MQIEAYIQYRGSSSIETVRSNEFYEMKHTDAYCTWIVGAG